ncbi:unnamed protein product, partial [Protopolystoma xenopodis]
MSATVQGLAAGVCAWRAFEAAAEASEAAIRDVEARLRITSLPLADNFDQLARTGRQLARLARALTSPHSSDSASSAEDEAEEDEAEAEAAAAAGAGGLGRRAVREVERLAETARGLPLTASEAGAPEAQERLPGGLATAVQTISRQQERLRSAARQASAQAEAWLRAGEAGADLEAGLSGLEARVARLGDRLSGLEAEALAPETEGLTDCLSGVASVLGEGECVRRAACELRSVSLQTAPAATPLGRQAVHERLARVHAAWEACEAAAGRLRQGLKERLADWSGQQARLDAFADWLTGSAASEEAWLRDGDAGVWRPAGRRAAEEGEEAADLLARLAADSQAAGERLRLCLAGVEARSADLDRLRARLVGAAGPADRFVELTTGHAALQRRLADMLAELEVHRRLVARLTSDWDVC